MQLFISKFKNFINFQVPASPIKIDFLKDLPVDITVVLLQQYITPQDLLRFVNVDNARRAQTAARPFDNPISYLF